MSDQELSQMLFNNKMRSTQLERENKKKADKERPEETLNKVFRAFLQDLNENEPDILKNADNFKPFLVKTLAESLVKFKDLLIDSQPNY